MLYNTFTSSYSVHIYYLLGNYTNLLTKFRCKKSIYYKLYIKLTKIKK